MQLTSKISLSYTPTQVCF